MFKKILKALAIMLPVLATPFFFIAGDAAIGSVYTAIAVVETGLAVYRHC